MKIAVIGATGMIGHHTARAVLNRGHELTVIHRAGSDLSKLNDIRFKTAIADLNDEAALSEALSGQDAAINCAGYYPTVPRPWREEVETATRQMQHFYHAVANNSLEKAVYLGGAIALKKHPQGKPGNEELEYPAQPKDKNPYLQVKWAMDRQAKRYAQDGLPVVIGIPAMTFGEYDFGPTTGTLLQEVANQSLPGYVRGKRNVVYAGDAGRGLVMAAESGVPGERYLFTGENLSMDELIQLMAEISGVPAPRALPLLAARLVATIQAMRYSYLSGPVPKISSTAIAVMSGGQFIDGSKAKRELGYAPDVNVDEALSRAYRWFKKEGYVKRSLPDKDRP